MRDHPNRSNSFLKTVLKGSAKLKYLFCFKQQFSEIINIPISLFRSSHYQARILILGFWFILNILFVNLLFFILDLSIIDWETIFDIFYENCRKINVGFEALYILVWITSLSCLAVFFMHHRVQGFEFGGKIVRCWKNFTKFFLSIKFENFVDTVIAFIWNLGIAYFWRLVRKNQDPKTNSHIFLTNFPRVHIIRMN